MKITAKTFDDLLNNYISMKELIFDLQDKINNALLFIANFEYYIPEDEKKELIKILKGE